MVSFIIPVYNGSAYVEKSVYSIINTCKWDYEIIIIDDGSTDDTKNIVSKITKINNNVKYYYENNSGVSCSRNLGIEVAKGDWICFVDADDIFDGSKCNANLDSSMDMVIYSKSFPSEAVYNPQQKKDRFFLISCILKQAECSVYNQCYLNSVWSKLYNKRMLVKNNIKFNPNLINGEDCLFNINCYKFAQTVRCIPISVYNYRISFNSATKRYSPKIAKSDIAFLSYLRKAINEFSNGDENRWNHLYCQTAINGLWITLFSGICHYKNNVSLKKCKEMILEQAKDPVYKEAIKALSRKTTLISLPQKIVLKSIFTPFCYLSILALRIKTRKRKAKQDLLINL